MQGINKIRLYLCINFNFTDYEKSTIVIIVSIGFGSCFAAEKVIKLPKPNMNRSGSVMNALSERHLLVNMLPKH